VKPLKQQNIPLAERKNAAQGVILSKKPMAKNIFKFFSKKC
jgi:hypothetical protein